MKDLLFRLFFPKHFEYMEHLKYEIEKLEKERDRCKSELAFRIKDDNILKVCGNLRGHRYDRIELPKWYNQSGNFEELGEQFDLYIQKEVLPTKRRLS